MGFINMGESKNSHHLHQFMFQDSCFQHEEEEDHQIHIINSTQSSSSTITSSIGEDSSSETDDAVSSASSSSSFSPISSRDLYDLSEIMTQLPIKRGLSKFYQGKSESFTSLSRVTSIEDLAKKANPNKRNLKASKSIGTGLHSYKSYTLPKAVISKRSYAKAPSFSCKRH